MIRYFALFSFAGMAFMLSSPGEARAQMPQEVDSVRLLSELSILAHDSMEGRSPGTPGSLRARAFLERAMASSGTEPVQGSFRHVFEWQRGRGENIVGLVPGAETIDTVIVITAHYDHLGIRDGQVFNGADDNASGSVALLEIARRLAASPLRHTALIALVDAEEVGSRGARAILNDELVPLENIVLNVNLDMVSRTGGLLWAAGAYHTPALRPVLSRVAADADEALVLRQGHDRPGAPEGDDWTHSSDHSAFHSMGIPFVYFGVEDHEDYHRSTDDVERVNPGQYVIAVRTILRAIRALDAALPFGAPSPL
jgi:Zn-dependent M28 family amino/carboxypeptidase